MYNLSEFRQNIKKAFDSALAGEEVYIQRGGVNFKLTAEIQTKPKGLVGTVHRVDVDEFNRAEDLIIPKKETAREERDRQDKERIAKRMGLR